MKIAIQGHQTRGNEVIQILESLGGKNTHELCGNGNDYVYYYHVNSCGIIVLSSKYNLDNYKFYTLEEFEKEFPFKIGDKVTVTGTKHPKIITGITDTQWGPRYVISEIKFPDSKEMPHISQISLYKEMKEERNIKLTFEKAKEWYNKGGELREIALQAFTEKEFTKVDLPKSWEEFCKKYPIQDHEAYIGIISAIVEYTSPRIRMINDDRNICPSKKSAEAHLAMIQLEQLRDCYRGLFITVIGMPVWCIKRWKGKLIIEQRVWGINETFLSFQSIEVAEEYLKNFKPLIKQAGDLI